MVPENVPGYFQNLLIPEWREQHRPRVHGNGFIQLDIDDRRRLHVWGHPDIPKQSVSTPIHDHVFGFTSNILIGRLVNINYEITMDPDGDFEVFIPEVRKGEDTVLKRAGWTCDIAPSDTQIMIAGATVHNRPIYHMQPHVFHETFVTEPTVSVIIKDGPTQAQGSDAKPRVLVPVGVEPDNAFNRYDCATEEELWRIIDDVVWYGSTKRI